MITITILTALGLFFLYQGTIETVVFNKKLNTLFVKRFSPVMTQFSAALPLSAIAEVYGVRRGVKGGHDDMAYYALIVKTKNDQELKVF